MIFENAIWMTMSGRRFDSFKVHLAYETRRTKRKIFIVTITGVKKKRGDSAEVSRAIQQYWELKLLCYYCSLVKSQWRRDATHRVGYCERYYVAVVGLCSADNVDLWTSCCTISLSITRVSPHALIVLVVFSPRPVAWYDIFNIFFSPFKKNTKSKSICKFKTIICAWKHLWIKCFPIMISGSVY